MGCFRDRRKERELFEKSTTEKLEAAERFKIEGNNFVKIKDYIKADIEYQKALIQFDYTFPDNPKDDKKMQELQEIIHCNQAIVKYNLKDYKETIFHADQVLKINKNNVKAIYRKVLALMELDDYERAQQELKMGIQIEPNNPALVDVNKKLQDKVKEYQKKEKNIYKSMFS